MLSEKHLRQYTNKYKLYLFIFSIIIVQKRPFKTSYRTSVVKSRRNDKKKFNSEPIGARLRSESRNPPVTPPGGATSRLRRRLRSRTSRARDKDYGKFAIFRRIFPTLKAGRSRVHSNGPERLRPSDNRRTRRSLAHGARDVSL